jgi:hypothetical protein
VRRRSVVTLTRAQLVARAEKVSRDLLGVSYTRACFMMDAGELHGRLADMYLSPLRWMLA